jgi:PAS domain S-box-containing protein
MNSVSRKDLEEQLHVLQESEQRLRIVLENLNDGLVIADTNGQLLHWNKPALEMHGFSNSEEWLLMLPEFAQIFELSEIDGAVLDIGKWPLPRVIGGERLKNVEVRLRRIDSDWSRIFKYGGSIVNDAAGKPVAFLTITDITERKRAEEELELLASIVNSSEDAIIGEDIDGKVISWNLGATRLYGYSPEEALGQSFWRRIPPERVDETTAMLEKRRLGERIHLRDTERLTKEGRLVHVSVTISPIRNSSGLLVGSSTIARDITEQNRIEDAHQRSEVQYRRLFEAAKDGILILDEPAGRIIDVNPFLVELLGYTKEELCGKELWEIGVFGDAAASKAAFAQLKEHGYIRYENLPLETRDGRQKQVEFVSNSYLAGEGCVIQCNIRDITERKLAEESMKQANVRLERTLAELKAKTVDLTAMTQQLWQTSKLATMGELTASIAHELNNPLAIISLRIESLAGGVVGDAKKSHAFEVIAQELDRMGKLIANLLQFSRQTYHEITILDVREEVENSLELIEHYLRAQNIEVVREFAADLPDIQADRQHLRQVFLNLVTNASDAMPKGGRLIARIHAAESEAGVKGVSIDLIDSGAGITPEVLARIWEPFFTTKLEGKGTGLGLAISRRAIEAHHGTLSIVSSPGKGTTVTIFLPLTNGWKGLVESEDGSALKRAVAGVAQKSN